jgi:hypothetical protein
LRREVWKGARETHGMSLSHGRGSDLGQADHLCRWDGKEGKQANSVSGRMRWISKEEEEEEESLTLKRPSF